MTDAASEHPYAVPGTFPTREETERMVENTLEFGWYSPSERRSIALSGDEAWYQAELDRHTASAFHSWEPIDVFLFAHSFDPDATLDHAITFAREWLALELAATAPDLGAAGRRALRLAYLAQATGDEDWLAKARELGEALESQIDPTDISLATTDAAVGIATLTQRLEAVGYPTNGLGARAADLMLTPAIWGVSLRA